MLHTILYDEIGKTIDPVRAIKEYLISSQIDSDSINCVVKCNELTLVQDLSAEMKELLKEWFVDEEKINVVISDLINSGARVFSFGEDYDYIPIGNVGSVFSFYMCGRLLVCYGILGYGLVFCSGKLGIL